MNGYHAFLSLLLVALLSLSAGCGGGSDAGSPSPDRYRPTPLTTWHWQLQGTVDPERYDVALYDIDLFDTPRQTIDRLHARNIRVICYFSAGSWEDWRPDAGDFPVTARGNPLSGWPGERWLDIRDATVRTRMLARLDLARDKGCDGVEPDNVDGYAHDTGFPLTAADQLDYNRFLARAAHERGLAIALKNDLAQIPDLVDDFDFALNEQCHAYGECDRYQPFLDAGKAVLNAEYDSRYVNDPTARANLCNDAITRQLSTLVLPQALDDRFRYSCL